MIFLVFPIFLEVFLIILSYLRLKIDKRGTQLGSLMLRDNLCYTCMWHHGAMAKWATWHNGTACMVPYMSDILGLLLPNGPNR